MKPVLQTRQPGQVLRKTPQTVSPTAPGKLAQKRPLEAAVPSPPGKKPNAGPLLTISVYSKAQNDELGIETLVGEYLEVGVNHGRKYFKRKKAPQGVEDVIVFLYYWDTRDGQDFSGWWFGDKVGGAQVWSRCAKADALPPTTGWRIPWDADVQPDLVVEQKKVASLNTNVGTKPGLIAKKEESYEDTEGLRLSSGPATVDERVQRATDRVVVAEIEATQALESASAMMEGEVNQENLKVVEGLLKEQQAALTEAHKVLAADIMEARKNAPKTVTALSKLTPRLRSVQASLVQETQTAKQLFVTKQQEFEESKKKAKQAERQLQNEQRDAKALEVSLPIAMDIVSQVEDAIEVVATAASPLTVEVAEEMSDAVLTAIKETEGAAAKAQASVTEARKSLSLKITEARQFAPEAKKVALAEYSALQEKLVESQKRLGPYLRVRKDFEQKLEAKKIMAEVANKLGAVEVEVEKVSIILDASATPTEEQAKSAEAILAPVISSLTGTMKFMDHRVQTAHGSLKEDLVQMQERGKQSKAKLDGFRTQLKSHLEQIQLQTMLQQALEKTSQAEEDFEATTVAETPFLKGDESLPAAEANPAIAACEEAGKKAEVSANQARNFLKAKLLDVKRFPEAVIKSTTEELVQLQDRAEAVVQKVSAFKRDTASRKTAVLLEEVSKKVKEAEAKVSKTVVAAEPLAADNKLEDSEIQPLKDATQQVFETEKVAALAVAEARKVLIAKQRDPQAKDSPSLTAELGRLQERLVAAQQSLTGQRKVALVAERIWKSKQVIQTKEAELRQVEQEIEKVEILTTPLGDERPSDENIHEMAEAVNSVQARLDETAKALEQTQQSAQGPLKSALVKLLAQTKRSQSKLDEIKDQTREQRERVQCEVVLKDLQSRVDKVDEAFQSVASAEVPYLKGMEILPLHEATQAVADSEAAIIVVQQSISEARSLLTSKSLEIRGFVPAVSKFGLQEIATLNQRIEDAVEKLMQFQVETAGRKRVQLNQEAVSKVEAAEEAVQKTILATAPLASQNVEDVTAEQAGEICEALGESEKHAQSKLDDARKFLAARTRDRKAPADPAEQAKLLSRLNSVQVDLAKAKATSNEHEQKFVAKLLMEDVRQFTDALDSNFEKATDTAAPLIVEGGKIFVVASMKKTLLDALSDHALKSGVSKESIFEQAGAKDGKIGEVEFTAFFEKVPELCSRPDLAFSAVQRLEIFELLDVDGKSEVTEAQFLESFRERHICVKGISVTDGEDIANSQTVEKLEVNEVVEALGEPKSHDATGVMRLEVRVLKDGKTGWVTIQGNQGTTYFEPFTKYGAFIRDLEKSIDEAQEAATKASNYINQKTSELRDCKQGPLADAKMELSKLRPKVSVTQAKLDQLRKKIAEGQRDHTKREQFERRKAEEKKERQAAAVILKLISEKMDKVKSCLEVLEGGAASLTSLSESDALSFATPMSVRTSAGTSAKTVTAAIAEAAECLKMHAGKGTMGPKGPWTEAAAEMKKSLIELNAMEKKMGSVTESVETVCQVMVSAKTGQISSAVRTSIQKKKSSIEALYKELAGGDVDSIPNAKFVTYLGSLKEVKMSDEQKQLVVDQFGSSGVTRRAFCDIMERYCICVKAVAMTPDFEIKDIGTDGALRKLEVGEYVEVSEGPKIDSSGLTRVRARAVTDNKEGWVTVRGNQGTPFLQDAGKPCYYAAEPVALQDNFASADAKEVRRLKVNEVVEVLEGPRKEEMGNTIRGRGKTSKDASVGWFTIKSKTGEVFAEPGKMSYTVSSAIALTDSVDIKDCKVLRKLDKGEVLIVLEGPNEDLTSGVTRIKVTAAKDSKDGWVTVKGNAGSVYAEESGRNYVILKEIPLQNKFSEVQSAATTVRNLAPQEMIELLEAPKEEKSEAPLRMRCRALTDGKVCWVGLKGQNFKRWSPHYKCVSPTALMDRLEVNDDTQTTRKVNVGETFELLQGPTEEKELGVLRVKCKANKDMAIGWMTISGNQGKNFLECIPPH